MYNKDLFQDSLDGITRTIFEEAIFLCYRDGIKSVAPLGFSGDTISLFGSTQGHRKSVVSIRNYGGNAELLITDIKGNFLFYGRFDINLGISFVVDQYWSIFNNVKHMIESELPQVSDFKNCKIPDDATRTIGFEIITAYQKNKNVQS